MIVRGLYPTYTEFLHPRTVTKLAVRTILCVYFLQEHLHVYYSVHLFFLSFFFFYVKKFEQFKGMSKICLGLVYHYGHQ